MRLDHLGDPRRGGQRLLVAGHRRVHLLGAADVELLGLEPHPRRVVERLAGVDAEQDVVRGGVFAGQVVGVAGRDQRQAHPPRDVDRALGAFAAGSPRRCPGSRRRSSPRRRPSDTRRRAARPRPSCRGGCSRRTPPRRSRTGRSAPRSAARGSPCRSGACSRTPPGTTGDESRIRLRKPAAFFASRVRWKACSCPEAPPPVRSVRRPGATYASRPTIGRMPAALASRRNSTAP